MGISFSNGVNTSDLNTIQPFNDMPLNKLRMIAEHFGEERLHALRVLDVGSNCGYNSIILTRDFNCRVTGIEYNSINNDKARFLAELCGVMPEFIQADAGSYQADNEFDLILHLGTLYHLPDPVNALKCAAKSLKPGGRIYIETAVYNGDNPNLCRFLHGFGGDYSNYWALSPQVIEEILTRHGMIHVGKIMDFEIAQYEGTGMSRAFFSADKTS